MNVVRYSSKRSQLAKIRFVRSKEKFKRSVSGCHDGQSHSQSKNPTLHYCGRYPPTHHIQGLLLSSEIKHKERAPH
jgi:hypothetical protein